MDMRSANTSNTRRRGRLHACISARLTFSKLTTKLHFSKTSLCNVHIFVCMWNVDHNNRHWKKNTGIGDEIFPPSRYLVQRSHNQSGSENQKCNSHLTIWRPPDFSEKTQTEVVWARHTIIWTGQDYSTGNSTKTETKRQTEETMGRNIKEWTGLEWNILLRKAEKREEWRKLVVKSTVVPQRSARLRDR